MDEKKNLIIENKAKLRALLENAEVIKVEVYTDEVLAQMSHEDLENMVKEYTANLTKLGGVVNEGIQVMNDLNEGIDDGLESGKRIETKLNSALGDASYYKKQYEKERQKVEAIKKMIQTWEF